MYGCVVCYALIAKSTSLYYQIHHLFTKTLCSTVTGGITDFDDSGMFETGVIAIEDDFRDRGTCY